MQLTWKDIPTIPNANEFLDVVLNRTQRKTPTVIRAGFKITRIRAFYMRKVRYTADGFSEKLQQIVDSFPNINEIHPFHRDLLDTLYEKNHYKVSLAAVSRAKSLVEQVSRDYVRLLKFGQSLFQCKQLKRAAMGRMATIVKRLKDALLYLEQVRQHLGRLPSIDPNTRTLLICGYPNVGKSSFLKSITRADVEVQPYAFTTKSLYVGHFDYKYLRFQAIDTPGILDRPTEEMNNIEMQSIYAIAHIRSCVLYFMDLSEQCGFSVADQVKLFHSIKPLFANKSVMVVINKIDLVKPQDLDEEKQALLKSMTATDGSMTVEILQASCHTEEGIMDVRNKACDKLLTARIEQKMKSSSRINSILNKIHVARPSPRDDVPVARDPFVPAGALERATSYDPEDPNRRRLQKDIEIENGGAGVFQPDYKDAYILEDEAWKHDIIPELLDGKNVYDFIDPEISAKLQALEEEEEKLEQQGFYDSDDDDMDNSEDEEIAAKAEWIRNKHKLMLNAARSKRTIKNRGGVIPRKLAKRTLSQMETHFDNIGVDASAVSTRARALAARAETATGQDVVMNQQEGPVIDTARIPKRDQSDRRYDGVGASKRSKAERLAKLDQRDRNRAARAGEGDRHTTASIPKHLFSGKRGMGKTQRR
ncbi:Nog1p [Sugiyamaella lignohabitans]|uniref:Nucleolar GTP-binding protein 1 n=1 Tax=Sugiyamaella lignohabitans TaxID=796027 RepID=A0A161HEH7_9ASCO|nr:Nog1p [Sugiyamaella lignohabitans]ANB11960.1 Nog1p [Sugiyamaella lignohabitans]